MAICSVLKSTSCRRRVDGVSIGERTLSIAIENVNSSSATGPTAGTDHRKDDIAVLVEIRCNNWRT